MAACRLRLRPRRVVAARRAAPGAVRIAEDLSRSGSLKADAIARGLETLEMFGRYLQARGVERAAVDAVATSAIARRN